MYGYVPHTTCSTYLPFALSELARWVELSLNRYGKYSRPNSGSVPARSSTMGRTWTTFIKDDVTSNDCIVMTESADTRKQDWADIRATLQGDGSSYERLVRRYQPAIASYLWRFTRDRQQWEELIQDTFVEAYLSLGNYAGRAPWEHWLKKIATRTGYRFWKQRKRHQREVPFTLEVAPCTDSEKQSETAREAAEIVHLLLAQLSPRDRLVMTLAYLEERSVAEIAELTNWSISMVKVQTFRARKRLAKICQQQGIEL